ncbi:MAG: sensor histidine kinase, partial [Hyphomicrobiales bacterium]
MRLFIWIGLVLLALAAAATIIRFKQAESTTQELYDKTLITVAHTISRDVLLSQGDVLAEELLETLTEALGDQVFYNVRSRENAFIAGYSDPPPLPEKIELAAGKPYYFDAVYRGDPVRVVSFREFISEGDVGGWVTVTTWQTVRERQELSLDLATRSAVTVGVLVVIAMIALWLAVNTALKPLLQLQETVERRSPDDLENVRRAVPEEVASLVSSMNGLFGRLKQAFAERDRFISDAAHQLRNPIAGIQSQAEATARASSKQELRKGVSEVAEAARRASRLTQQLLSMEKAKGGERRERFEKIDRNELSERVTRRLAPNVFRQGGEIAFQASDKKVWVEGDVVLISEAMDNLIDNAARYGAADEQLEINVGVVQQDDMAVFLVHDSGAGVVQED